MRNLILIGFFACLYLHFQSQDEVVEHDVLSIQQSAIKKLSAEKESTPMSKAVTLVSDVSTNDLALAPSESDMITEAEIAQEYDDGDDLSQLPWDDIEEGWKTHLKEYLTSVDPEKAEDMLAAYMEEKKKYVERVDFSDTENGMTDEGSAADPMIENDVKVGELERIHTDNLKEIFGDHYSQIESLHKEYVESVQYLNRSSVKFTISL